MNREPEERTDLAPAQDGGRNHMGGEVFTITETKYPNVSGSVVPVTTVHRDQTIGASQESKPWPWPVKSI